MTQDEVSRKLGAKIARNYAWVNHNVFDNLKELDTTSRGNRIRLNQTFLGADLKITMSGIKVHQDAGYGGGAKAVLPGVSALTTIEYNHTQILTKVKVVVPRIFGVTSSKSCTRTVCGRCASGPATSWTRTTRRFAWRLRPSAPRRSRTPMS